MENGDQTAYAGPVQYWKYDRERRSLGPAVLRYLTAERLSDEDIAEIALYLKRWISSPAWERVNVRPRGGGEKDRLLEVIRDLRITVRRIHSLRDIEEWHRAAAAIGIDPF